MVNAFGSLSYAAIRRIPEFAPAAPESIASDITTCGLVLRVFGGLKVLVALAFVAGFAVGVVLGSVLSFHGCRCRTSSHRALGRRARLPRQGASRAGRAFKYRSDPVFVSASSSAEEEEDMVPPDSGSGRASSRFGGTTPRRVVRAQTAELSTSRAQWGAGLEQHLVVTDPSGAQHRWRSFEASRSRWEASPSSRGRASRTIRQRTLDRIRQWIFAS